MNPKLQIAMNGLTIGLDESSIKPITSITYNSDRDESIKLVDKHFDGSGYMYGHTLWRQEYAR
jgi:hypothetical protein